MLILKQRFSQLINSMNPDTLPNESFDPAPTGVAVLWADLMQHYEAKGRHYHNLSHLENMFAELQKYPNNISDPLALELSIFYHDYVYRA
ncbi:MAG: hypothetical protein AAF840_06565, partial [Bacteroidota bacterium]